MSSRLVRIIAASILASVFGGGEQACSAGSNPPQDQRLSISLQGRTYSLAARVYRPSGAGAFPLVVINHGSPTHISDAPSMTLAFDRAAQWFESQGYVVVVALRPGYGNSEGPVLEHPIGRCPDRDFAGEAQITAAVESAIVDSARSLPGVDPQRVVVVGQSAGGLGAVALGDAPPSGVLAVISFAGGRGSDGDGSVCGGDERLISAAGALGSGNRVPQLWLYASNDQTFPPALGRAMMQAYQTNSAQRIQFVELPPFDDDGHKTLPSADPSAWSGPVSAFLAGVLKR
jgi:dienelactone hydrolase